MSLIFPNPPAAGVQGAIQFPQDYEVYEGKSNSVGVISGTQQSLNLSLAGNPATVTFSTSSFVNLVGRSGAQNAGALGAYGFVAGSNIAGPLLRRSASTTVDYVLECIFTVEVIPTNPGFLVGVWDTVATVLTSNNITGVLSSGFFGFGFDTGDGTWQIMGKARNAVPFSKFNTGLAITAPSLFYVRIQSNGSAGFSVVVKRATSFTDKSTVVNSSFLPATFTLPIADSPQYFICQGIGSSGAGTGVMGLQWARIIRLRYPIFS